MNNLLDAQKTLRLKELAGYEVPSFYQFIKSGKVVKGTEIELTETQWNLIDNDHKGLYEDKKHFLVFEMGALKIIPVSTSFIGGITNKPEQKEVKPFESDHDKTDGQGGDSEKTANAMVKAVQSKKKITDTKDVVKEDEEADGEEELDASNGRPQVNCKECGKNFLGDHGNAETVASCEDHKDLTKVSESAEDAAKKLIKAVRSGNRITDTKDVPVDSATSTPELKTQLGSEKVADGKVGDTEAKALKKVEPPKSEPEDTKAQGGNPVTEKWATDYETPESKKGMFDGKTKEELESELAKLKTSGPHTKGSAEFTKEKELMFALRAKNKFGKVDEEVTEIPKKSLKSYLGKVTKENVNNEKDANAELVKGAKNKKEDKEDYFSHNEKKTKKTDVKEETAVDVAERIIKSVKAGNHPHDAKNSSDAKTPKGTGFDYNKFISKGTVVDAVKANDANELKIVADKDGESEKKTKVTIPEKVVAQINTRLQELKSAQEEYDEKGFNDKSVKVNAIDFLEKVKEHLNQNDVEGFKNAQILFQTLMSPITDLLPAALVNFLATGRNSKEETGNNAE